MKASEPLCNVVTTALRMMSNFDESTNFGLDQDKESIYPLWASGPMVQAVQQRQSGVRRRRRAPCSRTVPNLAFFGKSRLSQGVKKSSCASCTTSDCTDGRAPWGFSRDLYKSHCHRGHHLSLSLAGKSSERQTRYTKRCLQLWS